MDNLSKRILEANTGIKANRLASDIHEWVLSQKVGILMDFQEHSRMLEKRIEKKVFNL